MKAKAIAHSNIALVKYWGKKDPKLNLPAAGSISVTLRDIYTISSVEFKDKLEKDNLILNGKPADTLKVNRMTSFMNIIREQAGIDLKAEVVSDNNFPTGAGLASSASAFASLALAGSRAANLSLSNSALSELARKGSGSAARSIFGGFVEMQVGEKSDGSDATAIQLVDENYWNMKIIIAITSEESKAIGSTEGMNHTANTSPFYSQWIYSSQIDLDDMRSAIFDRNFSKVGEIAEFSCLKMHAVAMSANPGIIYWNSITVKCIERIRKLRQSGIPVFFTIDAGPQVKAICLAEAENLITSELKEIEGVKKIFITSPGSGAALLEE